MKVDTAVNFTKVDTAANFTGDGRVGARGHRVGRVCRAPRAPLRPERLHRLPPRGRSSGNVNLRLVRFYWGYSKVDFARAVFIVYRREGDPQVMRVVHLG